MRRPPSLSQISIYRATAITGVIAISASVLYWSKPDLLEFVVTDYRVWPKQPWRLITSVFPHADVLHLTFNLYWLWVFGTCIEQRFGTWRTVAIFVLFAAGSSAAEFAILDGGIGLSGVVYGLFGTLWVMSGRDDRFEDVVDPQTVILFVVWFFICIALTITKIWVIANVAHASGAMLGVMLGYCLLIRKKTWRVVGWASISALLTLMLAAAFLARPYVNFSPYRGNDLARAAYEELVAKRPERAIPLLERAVKLNPQESDFWYNLGCAHAQLDQDEEAARAFESALELQPGSKDIRRLATAYRMMSGSNCQTKSDFAGAARNFRRAMELDNSEAMPAFELGQALEKLGDLEGARDAYEKAVSTSPNGLIYRFALDHLKKRMSSPPK